MKHPSVLSISEDIRLIDPGLEQQYFFYFMNAYRFVSLALTLCSLQWHEKRTSKTIIILLLLYLELIMCWGLYCFGMKKVLLILTHCSSNSLPVMLLTLADKKYFDSFFKNQNWFKKALDLKDTDSLLNNDYAVNMSNI